jgi:HSP20 family protein
MPAGAGRSLDKQGQRVRFVVKSAIGSAEEEFVMAITKTPYQELLALQDRMSRLFDGLERTGKGGEEFESSSWAPPVDIYETRDEVVVKVEVPGVTRDRIAVEVKDDVLCIRGDRPFERDVARENYHRVERPYGRFKRSFILGIPVRVDEVKAACRDGVLEVILPKFEEARPRKIEIG